MAACSSLASRFFALSSVLLSPRVMTRSDLPSRLILWTIVLFWCCILMRARLCICSGPPTSNASQSGAESAGSSLVTPEPPLSDPTPVTTVLTVPTRPAGRPKKIGLRMLNTEAASGIAPSTMRGGGPKPGFSNEAETDVRSLSGRRLSRPDPALAAATGAVALSLPPARTPVASAPSAVYGELSVMFVSCLQWLCVLVLMWGSVERMVA